MPLIERLMLLHTSGHSGMTDWEFFEMMQDLCDYADYL